MSTAAVTPAAAPRQRPSEDRTATATAPASSPAGSAITTQKFVSERVSTKPRRFVAAQYPMCMSSSSTTPSTIARATRSLPVRLSTRLPRPTPAARTSSAATTNHGPAEFDTVPSPGTACPKLVATPASSAPVNAIVTRASGGTPTDAPAEPDEPADVPGRAADEEEDKVLFMVRCSRLGTAQRVTRQGHPHPPRE